MPKALSTASTFIRSAKNVCSKDSTISRAPASTPKGWRYSKIRIGTSVRGCLAGCNASTSSSGLQPPSQLRNFGLPRKFVAELAQLVQFLARSVLLAGFDERLREIHPDRRYLRRHG